MQEYYTSLGMYTHHLQEALKKGNEFRNLAIDIERIIKRITTAFYPFDEYNLPPKIDSNELLQLVNQLVKLNDEIETHIQEANISAEKANKQKLKKKDL